MWRIQFYLCCQSVGNDLWISHLLHTCNCRVTSIASPVAIYAFCIICCHSAHHLIKSSRSVPFALLSCSKFYKTTASTRISHFPECLLSRVVFTTVKWEALIFALYYCWLKGFIHYVTRMPCSDIIFISSFLYDPQDATYIIIFIINSAVHNLMFFWPCIMNWLYINYQLLCTDYYLFIKY